jgi:hypothetical protein
VGVRDGWIAVCDGCHAGDKRGQSPKSKGTIHHFKCRKGASTDKFTYENKIAERFGGQKELELVVPTPSGIPTPETQDLGTAEFKQLRP